MFEDFNIDRDDSDYNFRSGPEFDYEVQADTTYTLRVYLYNDQGQGINGSNGVVDQIGRVTFDDSQFVFTSGDFVDTDQDGIVNSFDIDSDNDGITDNLEAQSTRDYIAPSGIGGTEAFIDTNKDGLDDRYDSGITELGATEGHLGDGLTPVDSDRSTEDGDGTQSLPDFLDADSDQDGKTDQVESGLAAATSTDDTDQDGLLDAYEGADVDDGFDVNDENLDAANAIFTLPDSDYDTDADGSNAAATITDLDYRDDDERPFICLLYTSPSPRDATLSRMPSSA